MFVGSLCAYFARKRGRNPTTWFFVGFLLGLLGVLLVLILPPVSTKKPVSPPPAIPPQLKQPQEITQPWYYLDQYHAQKGPLNFDDLVALWDERVVIDTSYVWTEGMHEWRRINELPLILDEIKKTQRQTLVASK